MPESPRVLSVSVGLPRTFDYHGRPARSAIWKSPVAGRIAARGINLAGDDQADRGAHGGYDKAVYAYAVEDVRWWEEREGRPFATAELGENLTTEGVAVNDARIGERWRIGATLLEVSEPRIPCWRLGVRVDDPTFVGRFITAQRPGAYLRIIEEGDLGAGDEIWIVERPDLDFTVRDVFHIYTQDRSQAGKIAEHPKMSEAWKRWAQSFMEHSRGGADKPAEMG